MEREGEESAERKKGEVTNILRVSAESRRRQER